MKRVSSLLLAVLILLSCVSVAIAEKPKGNPDLIDWFNESDYWMTVANGHWSHDPADRPTDEELTKMFSMAMKQQSATHRTPYFFIVVKDVEEQRKIIGDQWAEPSAVATEGTVTILILADCILSEEEGHVSEYSGAYKVSKYAPFDSGMATGLLEVAAASLGYHTHFFGAINGEYAPFDLADGKYQSLSRYVKDEYMRVWGFRYGIDEEITEENNDYVYPVKGNTVFLSAIVIGKPLADETIETWGTNHARPNNWAFWD